MKRIRKVSQSIPIKAKVVNSYSESEEETYSCDYVNEHKQDKLTAGTGIEITGKNIINNLNANYSTEEVKIGTWVDGKPLYRKVVMYKPDKTIGTEGTTSSIAVPHNISNLSQCIHCEMFNAKHYRFPMANGDSSGQITNLTIVSTIDNNYINITIINDFWGVSNIFYFILEYTKTTD